MTSIAKFLRFIAKYCDLMSWAWRARRMSTVYHEEDGAVKRTRKGFWYYLRNGSKNIKWGQQ